MPLHLIKLCVGIETADDLERLIGARSSARAAAGEDDAAVHVTRQTPRRAPEILDGGSLYWVLRGVVCARQPMRAIEPFTDGEGVPRCRLVMEPTLFRTQTRRRKAFQGWRYLSPGDAPADIASAGVGDEDLPPHLARELAELGLL